MSQRAEALHANFKGWVATASLAEILVILDDLEDELIERQHPAAALLAQAAAMVWPAYRRRL